MPRFIFSHFATLNINRKSTCPENTKASDKGNNPVEALQFMLKIDLLHWSKLPGDPKILTAFDF
jgi:hypothetical protein